MPAKNQTGFLQALDDMVRITANGLTLGGADWVASKFGEKDTAAKTAAARDRAGLAGDAASVLGAGKGIQLGWQGLKQLPKLVKPAISKAGGLAALGGLGTLVAYNDRTGSGRASATPAVAAPAAAAATKRQPNTARADRMADDIMSGLDSLGAAPPTFQSMAQQVADSQGGNLSLRQLLGISEVAQRSAVKPAKQPSAKDVAGMKYLGDVDATFEQLQAQAQAKLEAGDQSGLDDGRAAVAWRMQQYEKLLGGNPLEDAMAEAMRQAQEPE